MTTWAIKVLNLGTIAVPKIALTPGFDPELTLDFPYLGFLLQDGRRNILVDSGISDNFIINGKAWGGWPAQAGRKYLEKALAEAKVGPDEIETVIYTHLHNDHAANSTIFTNATLVFQKDEWTTLLDPLPAMNIRRDYDPELIAELKSMNCLKIEGDLEFTDGIKLFKTPGHTPGSQSVAVNTKKGTKVLVGDHWHLNCMAFAHQDQIVDIYGQAHKITPAPPVYAGHIPSTLIYNYYDYYDSCYKIKSIMKTFSPEFLVAGHEPSLLVTGA
ncbi:MAG: N-acyl homoserine lactonase family protein [Pseudomonadota bacterium]